MLPHGVVRVARPWNQVVRAESVENVAGPAFTVPFAPAHGAAGHLVEPLVECCYMVAVEDLWAMEADLFGAVLVRGMLMWQLRGRFFPLKSILTLFDQINEFTT